MSESHPSTQQRLCPKCDRNWISGSEQCNCDPTTDLETRLLASSAHTPGPWRMAGNSATGSRYVESQFGHLTQEVAFCGACKFGDSVANARLIAAAPELLASLRTVRDWMDDPTRNPECPFSVEVASAIREAVAKAAGRS